MTQLANPFSTGGGGALFEASVQADYVMLMLMRVYVPGIQSIQKWPIKEVRLQTRKRGWETDDLAVVTVDEKGRQSQIVAQIKHSINITKRNDEFAKFIRGAWKDFNNPLFTKDMDSIALITGPLSNVDTESVPWLCNQARSTVSGEQFINGVNAPGFSSKKKREKLNIIRHHLKEANDGNEVSDDGLHSFLKHFHLLQRDPDFVQSLFHAHIVTRSTNIPSEDLWSSMIHFVQSENQHAGTITPDNVPDKFKDIFKSSQKKPKTNWAQHPDATHLALAVLIGAWNGESKSDIEALSRLFKINYDTWLQKAQELLHCTDSPLLLLPRYGIWGIVDRIELWNQLGSRIMDRDLNTFKSLAVAILKEHDPAFTLPASKRHLASIHGKVLNYSRELRKGIAEGLAILGNLPNVCSNCTQGKPEDTATSAIHEIFTNADWILWGSLDELLPDLAEVAPRTFLRAVKDGLRSPPCPFGDLFAQEEKTIRTGRHYLTGLLGALKVLAWDEKLLFNVCEILMELDSIDPGGNWSNRPFNSLVEIFSPRCPQTTAPSGARLNFFRALSKDYPDTAWKVLIKLLPGQTETSSYSLKQQLLKEWKEEVTKTETGSYSHKPQWRTDMLKGWKEEITTKEYQEQVTQYANLAVELAKTDDEKLIQLTGILDYLPHKSGQELVEYLSLDTTQEALSEKHMALIWEQLTERLNSQQGRHKLDWPLGDELIKTIKEVVDKFKPKNPLDLYRRLFINKALLNLSVDPQDLDGLRKNAIRQILDLGGIETVLNFARSVELPDTVGDALERLANKEIESAILPECLASANASLVELASSFVWERQESNGKSWVDGMNVSSWSVEQKAVFLRSLRFNKYTWDLATKWLGTQQADYWMRVKPNPSHDPSNLGVAIDKLLEYGRPRAAIYCLERMAELEKVDEKVILNVEQCVHVLKAAVNSNEDATLMAMDRYPITELIKHLQNHHKDKVSQDDLMQLEWMYLPLLADYPRLLLRQLSENPVFFCDVISYIYRSKRKDVTQHETIAELRAAAHNSGRLLSLWETIPGTQADGSFSDEQFLGWLQRVKEVCAETGHLETALFHVGRVLSYAPQDGDVIESKAIAEALNAADAEKMREGWTMGPCVPRIMSFDAMFESEAVFQSKNEKAKICRDSVAANREAGYPRIADSLEILADDHERRAEKISDRFQENP